MCKACARLFPVKRTVARERHGGRTRSWVRQTPFPRCRALNRERQRTKLVPERTRLVRERVKLVCNGMNLGRARSTLDGVRMKPGRPLTSSAHQRRKRENGDVVLVRIPTWLCRLHVRPE